MGCKDVTIDADEFAAFIKHIFFNDHGVAYICDYGYTPLQTQFVYNDEFTVNLIHGGNFEDATMLNFTIETGGTSLTLHADSWRGLIKKLITPKFEFENRVTYA
jgi:hypothetical protein